MWRLAQSAYPSDEDRAVSVREGTKALLARGELGFLNLHDRSELWSSSKEHADQIRRKAKRLVVVGMGGSSLGARAFLQACQGAVGSGAEVLFCDNVDPLAFERIFGKFRQSKDTHWVLISKSGGTVETLATAALLLETFGLDPQRDITVVTEPRDNPLRNWANSNRVHCLEVPVDVGGRFSVFSPVGLLPLAYAGLNLEEARSGVKAALSNTERLVLPLASQFLQSFSDEKWINILWSYADDLSDFGLWFQQLWSESLAKACRRDGTVPAPRVSTPVSLRGASDQHSVLQQIMEGERDKLVTFLRVKEVEDFGPDLGSVPFKGQDFLGGKNLGSLLAAEAEATETALRESKVPCLRLEGERLSERSVAELMQTFMITVGVLGEVLGINAFDQPGVEAGKIITKRLLAEG